MSGRKSSWVLIPLSPSMAAVSRRMLSAIGCHLASSLRPGGSIVDARCHDRQGPLPRAARRARWRARWMGSKAAALLREENERTKRQAWFAIWRARGGRPWTWPFEVSPATHRRNDDVRYPRQDGPSSSSGTNSGRTRKIFWQFHCGNGDYNPSKLQLVRLDEVVGLDPTVVELAHLPSVTLLDELPLASPGPSRRNTEAPSAAREARGSLHARTLAVPSLAPGPPDGGRASVSASISGSVRRIAGVCLAPCDAFFSIATTVCGPTRSVYLRSRRARSAAPPLRPRDETPTGRRAPCQPGSSTRHRASRTSPPCVRATRNVSEIARSPTR